VGRPERHLFVCTNRRPDGGKPSCGARGAAVLAALEAGLAAHPALCASVSVTGSACLGPCFDGPTVVAYPEAVWYGHVAPWDVAEIIDQHLAAGRPVERLRYRWPE
jgi:(2Fe-2S) ferredoxin